MKKLFAIFLAIIAISFVGSQASATPVDFSVTFTADNVIDGFSIDSNGTVLDLEFLRDASWANWKQAYRLQFGNWQQPLSLVWEIGNLGSPGSGNPGGFLAEVSGDLNSLTSSAWEVSLNGTNWFAATEYGANNSATIWNNANRGPIEGISGGAQWIWWEENFANSPETVFVKIDFAPVPEPATMMLFGIGLLGLAGVCRRKK